MQTSFSYFAERIEELRRDWPLLMADANAGQRLCEEITEVEEAMRELLSNAGGGQFLA
jgi:hypothetical protein